MHKIFAIFVCLFFLIFILGLMIISDEDVASSTQKTESFELCKNARDVTCQILIGNKE